MTVHRLASPLSISFCPSAWFAFVCIRVHSLDWFDSLDWFHWFDRSVSVCPFSSCLPPLNIILPVCLVCIRLHWFHWFDSFSVILPVSLLIAPSQYHSARLLGLHSFAFVCIRLIGLIGLIRSMSFCPFPSLSMSFCPFSSCLFTGQLAYALTVHRLACLRIDCSRASLPTH